MGTPAADALDPPKPNSLCWCRVFQLSKSTEGRRPRRRRCRCSTVSPRCSPPDVKSRRRRPSTAVLAAVQRAHRSRCCAAISAQSCRLPIATVRSLFDGTACQPRQPHDRAPRTSPSGHVVVMSGDRRGRARQLRQHRAVRRPFSDVCADHARRATSSPSSTSASAVSTVSSARTKSRWPNSSPRSPVPRSNTSPTPKPSCARCSTSSR